MSKKELVFLFSPSKKILTAADPQTGLVISFNEEKNKWFSAPRTYSQIMGDTIYDGDNFECIKPEKAKTIYKDIEPDEEILNGGFYE